MGEKRTRKRHSPAFSLPFPDLASVPANYPCRVPPFSIHLACRQHGMSWQPEPRCPNLVCESNRHVGHRTKASPPVIAPSILKMKPAAFAVQLPFICC